jgi:hypothetical protein
MSTDPEEKPSLGKRLKDWLHRLFDDPISTLMESAVWIFGLAIGIWLVVLFARMGWNMIHDAWK